MHEALLHCSVYKTQKWQVHFCGLAFNLKSIKVLLIFDSTVLSGLKWFDTACSYIKAGPSLALACTYVPQLSCSLRDENLSSISTLHACARFLPILLGSNTVRLHSARLIVPAEALRCSSVGSMLSLWQCNLCIPM